VSAKYREHWPRIGAVLTMLIGGATAASAQRLTKPQILSAANLMALMAHQFEEYVYPGYFPGQFNRGLFNSDSPRNYPLNPQTAMVINTCLAYPFYVAPVLLPKNRWLGLTPVLVGWSQIVLHGVVIPQSRGKIRPGGSHGAALTSAHRDRLHQGDKCWGAGWFTRPDGLGQRPGRRGRQRRVRGGGSQHGDAGSKQPVRVHGETDGPL
jgi:hypothetical protein